MLDLSRVHCKILLPNCYPQFVEIGQLFVYGFDCVIARYGLQLFFEFATAQRYVGEHLLELHHLEFVGRFWFVTVMLGASILTGSVLML